MHKLEIMDREDTCTCTCDICDHRLSVLNHDVRQLYTHGNAFLLILTYRASCVQNLESVHPSKLHDIVHVSKYKYDMLLL